MTLVTPHAWSAGDDATSTALQTLTDGVTQLQGGTPTGSGTALDFAVLRQTVTQTLTTGIVTNILMDVEDADAAGGHSTVTNTSRYVAQNTGWYEVQCGVAFAGNANGLRLLMVYKGGNPTSARVIIPSAGGTSTTEMFFSKYMSLTAGEYIECMGRQDSGGNLATAYAAGTTGSFMNVRWIHS